MAIKERKQITGTTAQINAYEGHEGQIVWDKDKKTLVGMSGTAGNNYPLASQAYVDTQFLPLTGGTIVGGIRYSIEGGEFDIRNADGYGARLALNSANRESLNGRFIMQAHDGTHESYLIFHPNGELRLDSRYVDNILQQSNGVVRYASGLQIVGFNSPITNTRDEVYSWKLAYPLPFVVGSPLSISVNVRGNWGYATTTQLEYVGPNDCGGTLRRNDGGQTNDAEIHIIAIGYWK